MGWVFEMFWKNNWWEQFDFKLRGKERELMYHTPKHTNAKIDIEIELITLFKTFLYIKFKCMVNKVSHISDDKGTINT